MHISGRDYTPAPHSQSYGSHGTKAAKCQWYRDLGAIPTSCVGHDSVLLVNDSTFGSRAFSTQHSAFSRRGHGAAWRAGNEELPGLDVWQKARQTLAGYRKTARFPREEIYGLTSQIRRCSASIAANIAEGCGKRGNNEFQRFLRIATGSASELEYHFLLAKDLGFLADEEYRQLERSVVEVNKDAGRTH